jgi:hypothetical protein
MVMVFGLMIKPGSEALCCCGMLDVDSDNICCELDNAIDEDNDDDLGSRVENCTYFARTGLKEEVFVVK